MLGKKEPGSPYCEVKFVTTKKSAIVRTLRPAKKVRSAFLTITTVGYGDKFPVTSEGRLIAAFLMTAGVELFGTFTGFVASWFVEDRENVER